MGLAKLKSVNTTFVPESKLTEVEQNILLNNQWFVTKSIIERGDTFGQDAFIGYG